MLKEPNGPIKGPTKPAHELTLLLEKCFDRLEENPSSHDSQSRRQDFVFHMTDWIDDLHKLADLYRRPQAYSPEAASHVISGFMIHAIAHLKAARNLYLGKMTDAFDKAPKRKSKAKTRSKKSA